MIKQTKTYFLLLIGLIIFSPVQAQVVIQRCDMTAGWKGNWVFSIDNTDKKEGDGSLKINAQTGTSDWFRKSFSRTHTGMSSSGYLMFWLYLSDASKLVGGQIEISSAGEPDKSEHNWAFDKNSVTTGWNLMQLKISDANQIGGGADLSSINFFRIYQNLSGPITAKIDFVRFAPSTGIPVWPLLNVSKVDNSSLDGKVMFGYQGWFNHPDDGAGLGWVHWGNLYEPIKLSCDNFPDMREYGQDEKYPSHFTYPNGAMASVFSSYNENTVVRHMKWLRDYNLDGVFIQRFISAAANQTQMKHKDVVAQNVRKGCEKYGGVYAMMYDGLAGKVNEIKSDWIHLVDDIKVTESDRYLRHRGLPLVSLWGYTVRDDATVGQLLELIEFFTNNPNPKYRASVKVGVSANWYASQTWLNAFKKVAVVSPWFSGTTDYNLGQAWCDANNVDFHPVVHPGFSWHNLATDYSPKPGSDQLNKDPRDKGNFLWYEVNEVVKVSPKSVYIAMFDEMDEGTAMFKLSETKTDTPREREWVTLDIDGYKVPSDYYLRVASLTSNVVRGYEDNKYSLPSMPEPPKGRMTIHIIDEANDNNNGGMNFIFPDFPNESKLEISIDGGQTFPYSTADNAGNYKIEGLNEGKYKVFVRHSASSPMVDMGNVNIANITAIIPEQPSNPFPENNAKDIRLNLSLGWTNGAHTVSNYIYFGTSSNPDSMKYQVSNSYNPGDLKPNTTYYWRIDEGNGLGITKGPLWKFTTGNSDEPADGVVLDYCDDVSGWSSSNSLKLNSTDKKEGFASLTCTGGAVPRFTKTFQTPVNSKCTTSGYLNLWLYVSDVSKFSGNGQIEITSSGKNDVDEYSWSTTSLNLVNGWNNLKLPISGASKIGNPNLSAINFFRLYQNTNGAVVEFMIDYIWFSQTLTAVNESVLMGDNAVKLFPNPASSVCQLQLKLNSAASVNVAVFSVLGQEMKGLSQEQNLDAGSHLISLPINGLNLGTYIVKTRINHTIKSDILIVQ
jgi:hypothetical protein